MIYARVVKMSKVENWIDKHSINCIKCGKLVDERDCIHSEDGEGEICPNCVKQDLKPKLSGD